MAGTAMAADLRIGLQEDPDVLDPDQSRTFVGRIVYTSLCDKLVDITPELDYVPQLATEWTWSDDGLELTMKLREGATFHDGTPFNAEAVVANIERSQNLPESRRKSELASVAGIEATSEFEVKFKLSAPDATLLAQLSDRAGMMESPKAQKEMGLDFANNPVCSGPYKFVERIQQDRIVLEKFAEHWNADQFQFEKVTFLPIPDTTVRLANLQAGDIDMLERLAPTDAEAVKADSNLIYEQIVGLGYQGITVNIGNGARADNPMGKEAKL
jgi:peptide/nickel transport system substrate-binding protein